MTTEAPERDESGRMKLYPDYVRRREELADLCHEQWSGWMRHLFSKCKQLGPGPQFFEDDLLIPSGYVKALQRQIATPYVELSEEEKDSDRKEAGKFFEILEKQVVPLACALQDAQGEVAQLKEGIRHHIEKEKALFENNCHLEKEEARLKEEIDVALIRRHAALENAARLLGMLREVLHLLPIDEAGMKLRQRIRATLLPGELNDATEEEIP